MNSTDGAPKIYHIASLWTLSGYGDSNGEWTIEKKLDIIKEAGFDGFAGRVSQVTRELVNKHNLLFAAIVDIGEESDVESELQAIKEVGVACVNVQMLDHDTPTEVAVPLAK